MKKKLDFWAPKNEKMDFFKQWVSENIRCEFSGAKILGAKF